MSSRRACAALFLLLGVSAILSAAWWIRLGVPVELAAAPGGRIACVSYAPYRKIGESPFVKGYAVPVERIDEDLRALSRRFDCVRTYSVGQGLDQVPSVARRYGMKVLLGAWLSRDPVENAGEIAATIDVANRERDVIRGIVVGNEVLLRGELPQRTIAQHLREVRAATALPVTYADVWEFWLKYREVAPAVDFITIHILPYWEDRPVAIEHAIAHVDAIYRQMQAAFPGREFLIGETGWPSAGRQRWRAVPSRVNEARFFREFMAFVEASRLPYNVIEAFDQPWKRRLEGTVGGYWGLYDDELRDKFPLTGPVVEDRLWWSGPVVGLAGAALFAGWGMRRRSTRAASVLRGLFGFVFGALGAAEVRHFLFANHAPLDWALMPAATVAALATAVAIAERVARSVETGRPPDAVDARVQVSWLAAATIVNLLLVFDARYRDFPSLLFAPVVVAFGAVASMRGAVRWRARREIEETMLAGALVATSVVIVALELPINLAVDAWAALCIALAVAAWANARPRGGWTPAEKQS